MKYYDFLIAYKAFDSFGNVVKEGKIKAKRKATEFEAMAGTEKYLKSKFKNITRIKVDECKQITWIDEMFGDFFKPYNSH